MGVVGWNDVTKPQLVSIQSQVISSEIKFDSCDLFTVTINLMQNISL